MVWIVCDDALECDCGMDSVRRCPFLMPLQEGTHHKVLAQDKNLNSASKVANCIIVDIPKYLYYPYIITGKLIFIRNCDC